MSTPQNPSQPRDSIRTRPGTAVLGLTGLIAIGLALLILIPSDHRTSAPTTSSSAHPLAQAAARSARTPASGGCFRDPANHALTCSHAAPVPTATSAPAGYLRDPATHQLLRLPTAPNRAGQHPASHSRGRIIQ